MMEVNFDLITKLATSESFRDYVRDLYKKYFENPGEKRKTMPKYISAEKLEKDGWSASRTYQQDAHTMVYETKKMTDFPAADVRENVHARWVKVGQFFLDPNRFLNYACSNCGFDIEQKKFNYCPNCGAKMEEEDGEIYNC